MLGIATTPSKWLSAASVASIAWAIAGAALAQGTPAPGTVVATPGVSPDDARPQTSTSAPSDAAATYPAAYFAGYNPVSAADMVARVPGFELRDGDERRGFGASAGNVLVNGERPSSKTPLSELLKRIPAASVQRIELYSGSNPAIDARGQAQIANVVINQATQADSATNYVLGFRHIQYSDRIGWAAQASRSIPLSPKATLSIDLQLPNLLGRGETYDRLVTGQGVYTGSRILVNRPNNMGVQGSAALRWRPTALDTLNFNVQAAPTWNSTELFQLEAAPSGALRSELVGETEYENNYTAEAGGDWEHRFSSTLSLKLIGLFTIGSVDQSDRFEIFTAPATNSLRTQDRTTRNGERIGRAQVKWTPVPAHTVEIGAEAAFNFRDTTLDIVNQVGAGPPIPVPLAVSDARVEEVRAEAFISDIWTVTPNLTLEAGFNFEISQISQTGDQEKERSFRYPKPRASVTYAWGPRNTLRVSLARDVAQLDFAEFSSAVDFLNTSSIQGNPDLKPETAWKSRVEWETRFGARAALTLALFADRVQDVHDLVVIGGLDAYGNIGDGERAGVEVRASTPLGFMGLPDSEIRFSGLYQQTRVTDPITGETRSFSVPLERQGTPSGSVTLNAGAKDWAYVLNFRQNLPKISSSAGLAVVQWSSRSEYRRAEATEFVREQPRIDLFFETTAIEPVTLRVFLNNILPSEESRVRAFYVGDRSSGVVQRYELREVLGGPEGSRTFGMQISGRF